MVLFKLLWPKPVHHLDLLLLLPLLLNYRNLSQSNLVIPTLLNSKVSLGSGVANVSMVLGIVPMLHLNLLLALVNEIIIHPLHLKTIIIILLFLKPVLLSM
jgi:hypothetical protein